MKSCASTLIEQGMVTASLMLRKLGKLSAKTGWPWRLRELGRIERSLSPWISCKPSTCAAVSLPD